MNRNTSGTKATEKVGGHDCTLYYEISEHWIPQLTNQNQALQRYVK